VDETVLFRPLRREQIKSIVSLLLEGLQKRLDERKITLALSDEAASFIADKAYDPVYGARPLRRYLQRTLETPLARKLIAGEINDGAQLSVDLDGDDLVFTQQK